MHLAIVLRKIDKNTCTDKFDGWQTMQEAANE